MELASEDTSAPPAFGTIARADFLLGMANVGKKFVLLLDLDRVLSADELRAMPSAGEVAHV
jgi:purine-binding chemotaxis protein CheW